MDSDTMITDKTVTDVGVHTIPAMRKTPLLCQVTDPEEKRRIIGDTFMRVANEVNLSYIAWYDKKRADFAFYYNILKSF